jgi:hypothetical protein
MTILAEERPSDSPFVEKIMHGRSVSKGFAIRPAEVHWHMVFVKHSGRVHPLMVGPLKTAGIASWGEGAEILWIKFKLGAFMPHLPVKDLLDGETALPEGGSRSFWLKGSTWQFPDYDNAETFVERLVREDVLARDEVVEEALQGHPPEVSPRTIRHRFLRATGLTHSHIFQVERALRAEALLRQGVPILETVYDAGYYDQPHLTRSLKQWIGHTPGELIRASQPELFP